MQDRASNWTIASSANKITVVLHTIFISYAITYAIILIFSTMWFDARSQYCEAVDEFTVEESFHFKCTYISNRHTSCAILGCWLVLVAGYLIVLGAQSNPGWLLTAMSSGMAKFFATKWNDDYDVVLPLGTGTLDVLVFMGFTGWFAILLHTALQYYGENDEMEKDDFEDYKIMSELDNVD